MAKHNLATHKSERLTFSNIREGVRVVMCDGRGGIVTKIHGYDNMANTPLFAPCSCFSGPAGPRRG
jgi:hypothetical protein